MIFVEASKVTVLPSSDPWTKWTAIGTISASIIALVVALGPPLWRRYWLHPTLDAHIGPREPWERVARLATQGYPQVWLRIEVSNKGRAEARSVRAVVHAWYERPDPSAQWDKRDLDPSALHWVSMPGEYQVDNRGSFRRMRETAPVISLPPGLHDFADLIVYTIQTNEHVLVLDDQRPRGFGFQPTNVNGEFVLTVTVVADNAKAITKHIHYKLSRTDLFTEVRFDKSAPKDFRSFGILTLMERMREQRIEDGGP